MRKKLVFIIAIDHNHHHKSASHLVLKLRPDCHDPPLAGRCRLKLHCICKNENRINQKEKYSYIHA
jgi:hypothetical protein